MADYSVIFAGFGGQGVLFMGKVTAYVGLLEGKEVSWMPSYGPEMRGGTANCTVCISDAQVGCPIVAEPDALIAMSSPSCDKFIDSVKPGGLVIYDGSVLQPKKRRDDIRTVSLPATNISNEENLQGIANMILLGKMFKETGFGNIQIIEAALEKSMPEDKGHLFVHNLRAIKLGLGIS